MFPSTEYLLIRNETISDVSSVMPHTERYMIIIRSAVTELYDREKNRRQGTYMRMRKSADIESCMIGRNPTDKASYMKVRTPQTRNELRVKQPQTWKIPNRNYPNTLQGYNDRMEYFKLLNGIIYLVGIT